MPESGVNYGTGNFLDMALSQMTPLAWYSMLLGYPVLGIWCCDHSD